VIDIRLVDDVREFSALRTEWNDLLAQSSADTIFLTWEWLFSWWQSYGGKDDRLYIITVRDADGKLIGLLPLYRRLQRWLPFRPIKTLLFIGDGSWDSDYLDVILLQGREEEILAAVWQWLRSHQRAWDLLQLSGIPMTSSTNTWLKLMARGSESISVSENVTCLVTDLPGSWDDYVASVKPRFRTKIRSTLREVTASPDARFRTVQSEVELKAGLETLFDLHGKRWESKGSEGVFRNPAKRRFYERFTSLFLEQGWLAFDFLDMNGRPVACQMCFRYRGTQFLLQEGFDPECASESVGIALRATVFKNAIQDGIRQYDFLAGLGRHKTQWQAHETYCRTTFLGPRTMHNVAYLKFPALMDVWRERVKSVLPAKVLEMRRKLAAS